MEDIINRFDTFEDFYAWLEADETDGKDGISAELKAKTAIRRASIDITRQNVEGETLEAREEAALKVGYEERMKLVYEEYHA